MRVVFLSLSLACAPASAPAPAAVPAPEAAPVAASASASTPVPAAAVDASAALDPSPMLACASAADCMVTTFGGCCASCPSAPHAESKKHYESQQQVCAVIECSGVRLGKCDPVEDASLYSAGCAGGLCTLKRADGKR